MAIYSVNQNRQFFVSTGSAESTPITKLGETSVVVISEDNKFDAGKFYVQQLGHGGLVRTGIIDPKKVLYATYTPAAAQAKDLKAVKVSLSKLHGETSQDLEVGEDYILRINFRQLYGMSDEDLYQKYGAVHCVKAMREDATLFWAEMIYSLVKNFSKVYAPLLDISVDGTEAGIVARATKVNGEVKLFDATGAELDAPEDGLYILEHDQTAEWALGTKQLVPVYFEVLPTTVMIEGEDITWGKVEDVTADYAKSVNNSFNIADMEYFYMGERADQYRMKGWPMVIPTKYFAVASKDSDGYDTIDIHYYYEGENHAIQRSEKTVTIVATPDVMASIKSDIEAALPEGCLREVQA